MRYVEISPLEKYLTGERLERIKTELQQGSEKKEFDRLVRMCKTCFERDDFSDEFAERLIDFYCWLIDQDKKEELCRLLVLHPFWGSYAPDEEELAPLCYAIYKHKTDIAEAMIEIQTTNDRLHVWESYQPGYVAIVEQQYDIVRMLLDHGVKEDHFAGPYTGIQLAAYQMDMDATRIFVEEYGHDVNKTPITKVSPLNISVMNDDMTMVEYLLMQDGIDVNKPDRDGKNAIERAKSEEVSNLLLQEGAVPADQNVKLVCAGIKAVFDNHGDEAVAIAKELTALADAKAVIGEYDLLEYAVKYDQFETAKIIIENGMVDLSTYDKNLFWLCGCVYRKDRHKRDLTERLQYMRLFEKHGYRFPFPEDSYQHNMAMWPLKEDTNAEQSKEARGIMQRAGVLIDITE